MPQYICRKVINGYDHFNQVSGFDVSFFFLAVVLFLHCFLFSLSLILLSRFISRNHSSFQHLPLFLFCLYSFFIRILSILHERLTSFLAPSISKPHSNLQIHQPALTRKKCLLWDTVEERHARGVSFVTSSFIARSSG